MKLVLDRLTIQGNATIGTLTIPGLSLPFWTVEDLWRNNKPRVSCIPAGEYKCRPHTGPKFKDVWEVLNVPGRSAILFHAGNSDTDTLGCILVGMGVMSGKLIQSRDAIAVMRKIIGNNGFDLQIRDAVSVS